MSGQFPPFPVAGGGGGGGSAAVDGNGPVFNVDGLLFGYPMVGRGGIVIENSDGRNGPLTIWGGSERVLIAREDLDCSTDAEIEIGPCAREGLDTVVVDKILVWGAAVTGTVTPQPPPPTSTFRASLWSRAARTGIELISVNQSYAFLTNVDRVLTITIPEELRRPSRYSSLFWKPSVVQPGLRLNIAVLCEPLRKIQKFT